MSIAPIRAISGFACALLWSVPVAAAPADVSALYPGPVRVSIPGAKLNENIGNDNGKHLVVSWRAPGHTGDRSLVFRTRVDHSDKADISAEKKLIGSLVGSVAEVATAVGRWTLVAVTDQSAYTDEVEPGSSYRYLVVTARPSLSDPERVGLLSEPAPSQVIAPRAAFFDVDRWFFLVIIGLMAAVLGLYIWLVRRRPERAFIRRIPGVDAIEEAVGRSTEMGRPVLYVTGVEEIQDIQTIASLLILGHVAEMTAEYDTELKVANYFPLTMVVAEEIVKQGFANAGRIDAHKPENVMFISAEQFAFAAGVNGLILRDRPATNIYLGRFFAESLILAETGYVTRTIQIAGTAELTQLPFFIAACDYTIIGEELYAVSAYLSREPSLLAMLKAADALKLLIMGVIVIGAVAATLGWFEVGPWLVP
ncbi:MAG: hypothetical protein MJE77_07950 [Proteobacteria bacterium]|nr:hypothetical protein [Pseudomonadota bacterium]